MKASFYRRRGKRIFDVTVALPALVVALPIMLILALSIRFKLGAPVIFRQQRPGRDGAPFPLLKFRTMSDARDARGLPLSDAQRLSGFGRLIRRTSMDELPSLFNVLRGDLSLVGPRPLLMEYLPLYTAAESHRHDVLPGITGWAQVHGRNDLEWEAKFSMDLWYVEHQSLALDLKILALTVLSVVGGRGVARAGHATTVALTEQRRRLRPESENAPGANRPAS